MTIFSNREQLQKALLEMINAAVRLEALEQAEKKSLESEGLGPEDVERTSYNEAAKELKELRNELMKGLENAKQNITSGFSKKETAFFNHVKLNDSDFIQDYYLYETYYNLANIVTRSNAIKPLYLKRDVPLAVEIRYREAMLCYMHGRFDACCILCRSIVEMVIKETSKQRVKQLLRSEELTLCELIDFCEKYKILDGPSVQLARRIKERGNRSIHTEILAAEGDAVESIKDTQAILQAMF
jgi:hypothetical protein